MWNIKNILGALVLVVIAWGMPAFAQEVQEAKAGDVWVAHAYCINEKDARLLSERVAAEGSAGYTEVMWDTGTKCWDSRFMANVSTPNVVLVEKVWEIDHPDGRVFHVWTARSAAGKIGWLWFLAPNPPGAPA